MHVFFSGIGGAGIGPLALVAHQAGYNVSGSDKQDSDYIHYLQNHGIVNIVIEQTAESITKTHVQQPIDWFVYSSAVSKEQPNHPELVFARDYGITATKRDEFINKLLNDTGQQMIAIAGTHGKTTTTAMAVWLFKQLGIPASYSVGAKLSFGDMGEFNPDAQYFIYEADEYDRNFLHFQPAISIIPGIAYDHPDIYPTEDSYLDAFKQFITQSKQVHMWEEDARKLQAIQTDTLKIEATLTNLDALTIPGEVNRQNAHLVITAATKLGLCTYPEGVSIMNTFPGVSRRFERITDNIYSDYAHTPEKISGALQLAQEVAGNDVVVVYEGLHNTRQHFIKNELKELFTGTKKLYVVPSYLAREDESLDMLTPEKLVEIVREPSERIASRLDGDLKQAIIDHAQAGGVVLCFSAGGGGSLDEWLRMEFIK